MTAVERSGDAMKDQGAGQPAPETVASLYHQAFREFGLRALWSMREIDRPTIGEALAIVESLRIEGNLQSRALAVQIEIACRAPH